MEFANILFGVGTLAAMFVGQVKLIKSLTAFIKEASKLEGGKVRLLSFGIGVVSGAFFLWPWIELTPGLPLSVYVLTGVLFLLTAGLTASGDYDLTKEKEAIESGVLGDRRPHK